MMPDYAALERELALKLGTDPLPIEPNISREYFEKERERIFRKVWLAVGRAEDIPTPGDYLVKDLPILQTSVLIVRGKDGTIRAFHNACKHRGNKVVKSCSGSAKGFMCGFHGWVYDLQGDLVHVPDEAEFPSFRKLDYPLKPISLDTWEGFVFINVDPAPRESLADFLGEMKVQLGGFSFAAMPRVSTFTAEVNVNWKVFEDAFLEGYHVAVVHRRSVADSITGSENPLCHQPPPHFFGRHRSSTVIANLAHQPTPAEAIAYQILMSSLVGGGTLEEFLASLPPGVNPERRMDWAFDVHNVFPNLWIFTSAGSYFTYNFWPLDVERTFYEVNYFATPARNANELIAQEWMRVMLRDSLREDLSTQESTQAMQRSGALTHMPLSSQEIMVRHQRALIQHYVDGRWS